MHTPLTITKGDGFTAFAFPREFYRGFKLELYSYNVHVYDLSGDGQLLVWGEYYCDGEGFELCKRWIDEKLGESPDYPIAPQYQSQYDAWKAEICKLQGEASH